MSTAVRRAVRATRIAAATSAAIAVIAACSSGGTNGGASPAASPSTRRISPIPSATASGAAAGPRARAYVLPASAAPVGFTPTAAEPETPAEKQSDQDVNRCLGLPALDPHLDEADGPDLDNQAAGTSVSTSADTYTATQVSTDVRFYGNPANLATISRCFQQVGGKLFATPDASGTTATIQSVRPLDISYLSHHVLGLRLILQVTATSGVASPSGAPSDVKPALFTTTQAATAATRTVPVYIDDFALASGRLEQQMQVSQVLAPPNAVLERGLASALNALLDHQ
ncbi:MAG: hypothetical protein ACQSGP_06140 [Frankia sp.]